MPSYDEGSLEEWALLLSDEELLKELEKAMKNDDSEREDAILEELHQRERTEQLACNISD